jgi:hypothetical protein
MDYMGHRSYEALMRHAVRNGRKNRNSPENLREQVDPLMCQAFTQASLEANNLFSEDKAQDFKDNRQRFEKMAVLLLNSSWVELLMGLSDESALQDSWL